MLSAVDGQPSWLHWSPMDQGAQALPTLAKELFLGRWNATLVPHSPKEGKSHPSPRALLTVPPSSGREVVLLEVTGM